MIMLIVFLIFVAIILSIVYWVEEDDQCCPKCGGELFEWKAGRLDCRNCPYKSR